MGRRRKRRPSGAKRPESTMSIVIGGISFVSVVTFFLFISMAGRSKGNTANVMGGLGVLFLFAGIGCSVLGFLQLKDANFSMRSRVIGMVAPIIATGLWLYLYMMGLLYG